MKGNAFLSVDQGGQENWDNSKIRHEFEFLEFLRKNNGFDLKAITKAF